MAENGDQLHEQDYTYENDQETFPDEEVEASEGAGDGDVTQGASEEATGEDPELEAIKARVREMEEEAEKLKEMQSEVEKQMNLSSSSASEYITRNQTLPSCFTRKCDDNEDQSCHNASDNNERKLETFVQLF